MKRALPLLIILAIFFGLSRLSSVFAQSPITLDKSFSADIYLVDDATSCGGSISLVSPQEENVLIYSGAPGLVKAKIGPFRANSELVFSLTPNPPCAEKIFFSNNPADAYVEKAENLENFWGIAWLVGGEDKLVVMFVGLTPAPIAEHRPAIFIHGLGGRPTDWTTGDKKVYFDTLKTEPYNYPENYLTAYSYADADGNPDTYDYQGDVTKISADLESYVNALSQKHLADGGDGKVDLVGFSLGGLVARQYLNTHSADHKIRKVITIGSPHEGSYVLAPNTWFEKIPIIGTYLRQAFNLLLNSFLAIPGREHGQPVDLNSPAAQQVIPGNSFLQALNNVLYIPTDPNYSALYGSIDAELSQKIFFFEFKKKLSVGDGLVLEGSATGIPVEGLETFGVSDEEIYKMQIEVVKSPSGGYKYALDVPSIEDYRVWHGRLIVHPNIVQKVVELLTMEE